MADEIDEAEEQIRAAVWAALSRWLVEVGRRVLRGRGEPPDPDAVWSLRPAWERAVDALIGRVIMPIMQRAYAAITGEDLTPDQRPLLVQHLAEVRNRMVRIPDEVYDLIAGQVSEGVNLGEGIPQLAERIEGILSATGSERWPNRAVMAARTEAVGALNAARMEAFRAVAADEGGDFEKVWISTQDDRTRPTHREADGQRVPLGSPFIVGGFPLMFPGDPSGPPQEVIGCRCSFVLVEVGEEVDMSDRQMRR